MKQKHTIWFTGLSLSGKTVLAESLAEYARSRGQRVEVLDGKMIRDELNEFFGYSRAERIKVSRVLCMIARLLVRHEVIPIVTSITPYEESRDFNRHELAPYLEIYVDCPVEVCAARDADGLYKRAMRGDIKHFVGIDDPYEIPKKSDLHIVTSHEPVEESSAKVNAFVGQIIGIS